MLGIFLYFLLIYLRFSGVEFFQFYYQDKMIIFKNGSVKISVDQARPLKSYNEIMDKHSF